MRCHIGHEPVDCIASGLVVRPVDNDLYIIGGAVIFAAGLIMFIIGLCLQGDHETDGLGGNRPATRKERMIGLALAWLGAPLAFMPLARLVAWSLGG